MSSTSAEFGRNLARIRKAKGLSQEALSKIAKVDRSFLSRVERGGAKITLDKAMDISNALGCDISELLP